MTFFEENKEKFDKLDESIKIYKDINGNVMPVMQAAQNIFGYLSLQVQKYIAEKLNTSLSEVYGIATFYTQFTLVPQGEFVIGICMGTACYVKGSQNVLDKFAAELNVKPGNNTADNKFTLNATRCLGACGLAPVIMINDDVFGKVTDKEVSVILSKY